MKVRLTLEIDDEARRGLGGGKPANRAQVVEEIIALWTAHLDDLRDEGAESEESSHA